MSDTFKPPQDETAKQCALVLAELKQGPRSTLDLRDLNVASPACRVYDLRKSGHDIVTLKQGRFALYVLRCAAGAVGGAAAVHLTYALAATVGGLVA